MIKPPSLRRMRVHYKEGRLGLFGRIYYEREIDEIVSGVERGDISTAEAIRRLSK